ncbi:SgcJ/EcaC family oxidoreductase [Robertkochia aurantiaca]|uniref:SgcJ/EcaC family oxidoreductase n=1 Tax=Robertkochia aurantiaca TaxID=2873700 RepID=UPI001CCB7ED5|nr:SgcJ/EcaC family oxidoreductase [Robertkochia sp. 3YJGBD-33]
MGCSSKIWSRLWIVVVLLYGTTMYAQQRPDTTFTYQPRQAAYPAGEGPLVLIDEGHENLHAAGGNFAPFAKLLREDGYRVAPHKGALTAGSLSGADILVIANALHPSNKGNWVLPNPSAFSKEEIQAARDWVADGGKLLLIADHMPFAGAAGELASAFGIAFLNGFAMTSNAFWPPSVFSRSEAGLLAHPVTEGLQEYESIDEIATFTGSAFTLPDGAEPILAFKKEHRSLLPDTAWAFNSKTPNLSLDGYYQGGIVQHGKGKVAVFGEAAMFTAQVTGQGIKAGFNSEFAPQNAQFILNLIHYLEGPKIYTGELSSAEKEEMSGMEAEILQVNHEMESAFNRKDYKAVAEYYSDDAVLVSEGIELHGREAIDAYWMAMEDRGIAWELENTEIIPDVTTAVQRGISRLTYLDYSGTEVVSRVKFTLLWVKSNEQWKIRIDHYSKL